MRIIYCTDSVCILGGVEIVTIVKANPLAKIAGNEECGLWPPLAALCSLFPHGYVKFRVIRVEMNACLK